MADGNRVTNTTVNHFNGPVDAAGASFGSGSVVNIHTTDDVEVVDVPATFGAGTVTNVFRGGVVVGEAGAVGGEQK